MTVEGKYKKIEEKEEVSYRVPAQLGKGTPRYKKQRERAESKEKVEADEDWAIVCPENVQWTRKKIRIKAVMLPK